MLQKADQNALSKSKEAEKSRPGSSLPGVEGRARPAPRAPRARASRAPGSSPLSKPRRLRGSPARAPPPPRARGAALSARPRPGSARGGQSRGRGAATARGRAGPGLVGAPQERWGPRGARARAATCSSPDDIWKESANGQSGVYFETANNDFSRVKRQCLRTRSGGF